VVTLAGQMETELAGARMAVESMLAAVRLNAPSTATINQVMTGRQLAERHAVAAVEYAMQVAGGAGFYRRPDWSGASATSRPPAIIRCRPGRRPNTPARWRWDFRWSGFSRDAPARIVLT
jgi:alkylation response protein AidB-like acyl-CoA dehydrogenase